MGKVIACNTEEVIKKIEAGEKVLVDFYSDTCGPCKMLSFVLDDVAKTVDDVMLIKVNFEQNPDACERYGVNMYPTMIIFEYGEEIKRLKGLQPKPLILKAIGK